MTVQRPMTVKGSHDGGSGDVITHVEFGTGDDVTVLHVVAKVNQPNDYVIVYHRNITFIYEIKGARVFIHIDSFVNMKYPREMIVEVFKSSGKCIDDGHGVIACSIDGLRDQVSPPLIQLLTDMEAEVAQAALIAVSDESMGAVN